MGNAVSSLSGIVRRWANALGLQIPYNIQINHGSNVAIGDNNTIIVTQSKQHEKKLRIAEEFANVELVDGDDKTLSGPLTDNVIENIAVHDPYIAVIGKGNIIYLLQTCDACVGEAFNFDQSVLRQLLPPRCEPFVLPSPGVDPRSKKVFDIMCAIVDQLYPLRDSGKWQEFERALSRLHSKYDSYSEIKCFLLLEECLKLTYQKRLKAAKRKAEECLNIVNNEADRINGASQDVFRVLANVASASIFRRLPRKKMGKAFQCLGHAQESAAGLKGVNSIIPKFALALLEYEQARWYMAFATMTSDTKYIHCNTEACKLLGLCIDRFRKLSDENQLYTARQSFALLYLARLSMPSTKCLTQPGKFEMEQCAKEAEMHLEEYQRSYNHLGDSPVAARVKYLMTRSELCFLKRNYDLAKDFGRQALEIAVGYGFELETVPAQNHFDHISRYCAPRQDKLLMVKNLSSGYTSSTSTDSDQKYTDFTGSHRAT